VIRRAVAAIGVFLVRLRVRVPYRLCVCAAQPRIRTSASAPSSARAGAAAAAALARAARKPSLRVIADREISLSPLSFAGSGGERRAASGERPTPWCPDKTGRAYRLCCHHGTPPSHSAASDPTPRPRPRAAAAAAPRGAPFLREPTACPSSSSCARVLPRYFSRLTALPIGKSSCNAVSVVWTRACCVRAYYAGRLSLRFCARRSVRILSRNQPPSDGKGSNISAHFAPCLIICPLCGSGSKTPLAFRPLVELSFSAAERPSEAMAPSTPARRAAASAPAAAGARSTAAEPTMISAQAAFQNQAHHSARTAPPLAPRAAASSSTGSEAGRRTAARPWPRRRARSLMAAAARAPAQSELGSTW
jgi:hypothetical protein